MKISICRKTLTASIILFILLLPSAVFSEFSIDFRNSESVVTANPEKIQSKNIRIDMKEVNPLTGEPVTTTSLYDIVWRFDYETLSLVIDSFVPVGGCLQPPQLTLSINDALCGTPIQGALVTAGSESRITGFDGKANFFNLPQPDYPVNVTMPGYLPENLSVHLECEEIKQRGIALLPALNTGTRRGDIRIVLTWEDKPEDLDAHLTGPVAGEDDRFHIYWIDGNNCQETSCNPAVPSWLDVDDFEGLGPETITITRIGDSFVPGLYRYSVHQYGDSSTSLPDQGDTQGAAPVNLSQSSASVKVYRGIELLGTCTPPPADANIGENSVWAVFELTVLDDGTLLFNETGTYYQEKASINIR